MCQERERRRLDMLMAKALEARKKEEVITELLDINTGFQPMKPLYIEQYM